MSDDRDDRIAVAMLQCPLRCTLGARLGCSETRRVAGHLRLREEILLAVATKYEFRVIGDCIVYAGGLNDRTDATVFVSYLQSLSIGGGIQNSDGVNTCRQILVTHLERERNVGPDRR